MNLPRAFVSSTIEGPRLPKSHLKVTKSHFSCQSLYIEPRDKGQRGAGKFFYFFICSYFGICSYLPGHTCLGLNVAVDFAESKIYLILGTTLRTVAYLYQFSNNFFLHLQTTPHPIDKCFSSIFWMLSNSFCLSPSQACVSQRSFTSGSSERHLHNRDERCKQIKEEGGQEQQP